MSDTTHAAAEPAGKTGKGSRPRSEISFPYFSLEAALVVPKVIHEQAGGHCSREQLAPLLDYSGTKNGGFVSKVAAARIFGLIDEANGAIRPTALATQVLSPVQAQDSTRGKVQAFLNVELYAKVYERFKGQTLPSAQGLENLFRNEYKVVPAQIKNALRNLMESAESAGFFDAAGRGRLVMPLASNMSAPVAGGGSPPPAGESNAAPPKPADKAGELRGNSVGADIPPAIYGLIRDLPEEGTTMTSSKRQRLIKAFEASINWLYPDSEEVANE